MRILSQGTKPAHKWVSDRRTSHPSIPRLCFLWILYACRVRQEDQLHPMWQVPRDSHDLATGDVQCWSAASESDRGPFVANLVILLVFVVPHEFLAPLLLPSSPTHALLPSHRPSPRCIISPTFSRRPHMALQCPYGGHVRRLPRSGLVIVLRGFCIAASPWKGKGTTGFLSSEL